MLWYIVVHAGTSSTADRGGGSLKDRKAIGSVGLLGCKGGRASWRTDRRMHVCWLLTRRLTGCSSACSAHRIQTYWLQTACHFFLST